MLIYIKPGHHRWVYYNMPGYMHGQRVVCIIGSGYARLVVHEGIDKYMMKG